MLPDARDVFLRKMEQLEAALIERTRLSMIDGAALAWELQLDGQPIAHRANRERRVALRFEVNVLPDWEELVVTARANVAYTGLALAPSRGAFGRGTRQLALDEFLRLAVVQTSHHVITVRDLLAFAANKAGGRHLDESPSETRLNLESLVRAIDSDEAPILANILEAVCAVVFAGLQPLRIALEA
jgi:hypothetical protein